MFDYDTQQLKFYLVFYSTSNALGLMIYKWDLNIFKIKYDGLHSLNIYTYTMYISIIYYLLNQHSTFCLFYLEYY